MRANSGLRHLLRGSTNRLFFCFPQLPSSTLPSSPPAHNQLKCVRTPLACQTSTYLKWHAVSMCWHVIRCASAQCVGCVRGEWKIYSGLRRQDRCLISCLWRWTYNTTQHTTTHHTLLLTCIHADVHVSLIQMKSEATTQRHSFHHQVWFCAAVYVCCVSVAWTEFLNYFAVFTTMIITTYSYLSY